MLPMPAALGSVSLEVLIDYHEKVGLLLDNREKGNRFGSQALYALEESMISRLGVSFTTWEIFLKLLILC